MPLGHRAPPLRTVAASLSPRPGIGSPETSSGHGPNCNRSSAAFGADAAGVSGAERVSGAAWPEPSIIKGPPDPVVRSNHSAHLRVHRGKQVSEHLTGRSES